MTEEWGRPFEEEARNIANEAHSYVPEHSWQAKRWRRLARVLGLPSVILTTVLSGSAGLSALLESNPLLTAGLAFAAAVIGAARSFLRPDEMTDAHELKEQEYLALRDEARRFVTMEMPGAVNVESLRARVAALSSRLDTLRKASPRISALK